jgi:ABC-type transport system involved in multi-copper enzyme maturation permease subunit
MATALDIPKVWRNMRTLAFLTLDTLFWSKKTIFVAIISSLVVGMSVLGRLIMEYRWIRVPFTPAQVFAALMSTAVIHFLVVFVTLFYGTALISEEVEGKTLTYLFVRPIPKATIMLGKFVALVWICSLLVLPPILLSYFVLYARLDMQPLMADIGILARDIAIVFLALLTYGAFFSLLGAWLKHSILVGLAYAFGWEGIVSYLPGFTRKLTITHYLQSIFPHEDTASAIAMMIGERTPPAEATITLVLMAAFFLMTACLILREREFVLEQ